MNTYNHRQYQDQYQEEDDEEMGGTIVPQRPVLVRYEVANNIFEVPERYKLQYAIGQGAYGIVCSAHDTAINEKVAIKKVFNIFEHDKEFQKRILREIKILKHFDHENIICLTDLIPPRSYAQFNDVYIVTDLMETDLRQIIKSDQVLTDQHLQYFLYQILRALKYIHSANVLHRDLKPSNILLNSDCELKICDFGLSRGIDFETENPMMSTPYVATRWYRAPELLLMWETATKAIDMWSVGCIFAELLNRKAFFPGKNYLHQLDLILDVLGTPNEDEIKGCEKAKNYMKTLPPRPKKDLRILFPTASPQALDLLSKMLCFDPTKRITVEEALAHPYLRNLHDETDEPTSTMFDFSFEEDAEKGDIRKMIYDEIMLWNLENNNIAGDALLSSQHVQNIGSQQQH
jgi:serine/threonine protein kinase